MSYLISFSGCQTKCVKFLFRELRCHKLQDFLGSTSKAMADKEKKRGR